ncbi:glycosyltransferase [Chloroflexota bacterium]
MDNKVSQPTSAGNKQCVQGNPLVSIITPALNGIKYLATCIQSVLNQSYPHIEHILADGLHTHLKIPQLSTILS